MKDKNREKGESGGEGHVEALLALTKYLGVAQSSDYLVFRCEMGLGYSAFSVAPALCETTFQKLFSIS